MVDLSATPSSFLPLVEPRSHVWAQCHSECRFMIELHRNMVHRAAKVTHRPLSLRELDHALREDLIGLEILFTQCQSGTSVLCRSSPLEARTRRADNKVVSARKHGRNCPGSIQGIQISLLVPVHSGERLLSKGHALAATYREGLPTPDVSVHQNLMEQILAMRFADYSRAQS
jgi:hypothetical protein